MSESDSKLKPLTKFLNYYASETGEIWEWKSGMWIQIEQKTDTNGYKNVSLLCPDGYRRTFSVHRLVACAWLGYQPNYVYCCHKDDVKSNNHYSNLYWGNAKSNSQDYLKNKDTPEYLQERLRIEKLRLQKRKHIKKKRAINKYTKTKGEYTHEQIEEMMKKWEEKVFQERVQPILDLLERPAMKSDQTIDRLIKNTKEPKEKKTKEEIKQARKEKQRQAAIEFLERMDRENGNVGRI